MGSDREKLARFPLGSVQPSPAWYIAFRLGDNGLCADGKGLKIHVVMGAVVMTIYQPRLWCGRYFGH